MKHIFLILAFGFVSTKLIAQSKDQINSWFYNLPIHKRPAALLKAIRKNESFQENQRVENVKYFPYTYGGKIIQPVLPKPGSLDSAKIKLNTGSLNIEDGYSGRMKWLFLEYFSSDTIFLNDIYKMASLELKTGSQQQKPTSFQRKDKSESFGQGIKYIFVNGLSELKSVSVMRVRYASGIQSLSIHFSGSTD